MKKGKSVTRVETVERDFAAVLGIITTHRARALMEVNAEMTSAYWEIGAFLSPRIHSGSWNTAVVGRLADYIKRNQPELRGYGKSNLYAMAAFYDTYSSDEFAECTRANIPKIPELANHFFQPVAGKSLAQDRMGSEIFQPVAGKSLPQVLLLTTFTNLVLIANHCHDAQEMLFYIVHAHRERLTKRELMASLEHDAYASLLGGDKKNYSKKLREVHPSAPVVLKDRAFLDYLALPERHKEATLRREIIAHIRDFILEMGKDFLFVDQEYTLPVGGEDFRADLLFFHRGLQCLVAFELKTRKFRPSDLGQLEFYLEALDRDVKKENENPSIGIILCREANRIVVEYAMSRAMSPVMVAQYKRMLIPKEVLQRTFEEYLALPHPPAKQS